MTPKITERLLVSVESYFWLVYESQGTEARVLIYQDGNGEQLVSLAPMQMGRSFVHGDVELTKVIDGVEWDLVFDFHSHHVMGAFWSATDDANERLRGITFGVYSWQGGEHMWLFRRWSGEFEALTREQVIRDG